MLKQETPQRTFESDTYPLVILSGDEHELPLLLPIRDARAVQARAALEEAAMDEETILAQAEEALVMG